MHEKSRAGAAEAKRIPCPLCGSRLGPAQKLHSVAYPAGREKIMHIHGCPHCAPPAVGVPRRCPVCGKAIPPDGFAVGRMWERGGKLHLHITGCTVCKPRYMVTAG
jgi:hypothetical protein